MARTAKKTAAKKKAPSSPDVSVKAGKEKPAAASTTLTPFESLDRIFEDFLHRRWLRPFGVEWPRFGELSTLLQQQAPSVDIVDRPKEVFVRAEIPGFDKENLDVSLVERTLTIKGSSRKEEKEEKDEYFRHEIRSGTFSRSVLLPADVNASKAQASFKDGVLELRLPKVRAAKKKAIPLST
jgi:HSP20 family protein